MSVLNNVMPSVLYRVLHYLLHSELYIVPYSVPYGVLHSVLSSVLQSALHSILHSVLYNVLPSVLLIELQRLMLRKCRYIVGGVPLLAPHAKNWKQWHVLHERRASKKGNQQESGNQAWQPGMYIMTSVVRESLACTGWFFYGPNLNVTLS